MCPNNNLISEFHDNGYLIVEALFSKNEVSEFIKEIHEIFYLKMMSCNFQVEYTSENYIRFSSFKNFFDRHQKEYIACMLQAQNLMSSFAMGSRDKIINFLNSLGLKKPVFGNKPIFMMSNKKTSIEDRYFKTPPHQDYRSLQGSLNSMVLWVSLTNTSKEVGPIEIIPGSHKFGLKRTVKDKWFRCIPYSEEIKDSDFLPVALNSGDAVFFSTFLVHRSGHNESNKFRYSLQFRYNDIFDKFFIEMNYPTPYVSDTPVKDCISIDEFPDANELVDKIFSRN